MIRFSEVGEEKGLFTFYKEQDNAEQSSTSSINKQPTSFVMQDRKPTHGRKQTGQSFCQQSVKEEEKNVYKFLANCVSYKRKFTMPIFQNAKDENIPNQENVRNSEYSPVYSKKMIAQAIKQQVIKIQEKKENMGKKNKNKKNSKTQEIYKGKHRKSKDIENLKVSTKQGKIKICNSYNIQSLEEVKKSHLENLQHKIVTKQNSLEHQQQKQNVKTSKIPTKMLDFQQKQNAKRKLINVYELQNVRDIKQKGENKYFCKVQEYKLKRKNRKMQDRMSGDKYSRDNSLRLPLKNLNINPKDGIKSLDQRGSPDKPNKSEHITFKLPELPNFSQQLPSKIKKRPLLLTEKSRSKFPDCLLRNIYLEKMQQDGKVKKIREGNSIVMIEHVKDQIMDGWQKRKIEFLKKLIIKNSTYPIPNSKQQ